MVYLVSLEGRHNNRGGPFSLKNRDFGVHNLLVNDGFETIGVIDLDGFMAAPTDVVA
jgi:aminoglycoside/choline kinase family phosphotransferase